MPGPRSSKRGGAGTGGKQSAGILLYRRPAGRREVLLVHPGGPFWQKKDLGAWSIPKGEFAPGEDPLAAAQREVHEETGLELLGPFTPLSPVRQPGGKIVHAWAVEGDFDPRDRAAWFELEEARLCINRGQASLLDQLAQLLPR